MKKKLLLSLVAIGLCLTMSAQSGKFYAEGVVKDSITGMVEPFVTLRLMKAGQTRPVAVATSDELGRFKIGTAQAGTYELQISTIGKNTITRTVRLSPSGTLRLGTLHLVDASTTLGEATVTAQRVLVKAEVDRIGYSMKEDPDAQTNTMLDMLRKVPMVQVDGDDNIQVNGSSSFLVYVNGKPNKMMTDNASLVLKNYPASAVQKVEVITDPGAKYDAEGVAGILNIVTDTETSTSGYTFTPSFSYNNRGYHAGFFGMAQFGKLTVSANYGYGYSEHPESTSWSERETFGDNPTLLRSEGVVNDKGDHQFGSLDASYEFDKKNLLSVSAGIHTHPNEGWSLTNYTMTSADPYSYNILSNFDSKRNSYDASVDYQHSFDKENQNLTLSYRFGTHYGNEKAMTDYYDVDNVPAEYDLRDLYSDPDTRSTEHTVQADFTTPIGKYHTLSTGVKYIYRNNTSDNFESSRPWDSTDNFIKDEEASIDYRHRADIAAAYGEYTLKYDKFSTRAGVRYEYSYFDVSYPNAANKEKDFTADFNDLVPSVNFGYNFTPTTLLKAGYNIRIGRPGIRNLSPYVTHNTAESQSYGNPNLDSEKAHNFTLGFSTFSPKLSINTTLMYTVQNNGLTAYSFIDENNILNTTYENFRHSKVTAISVFINWTPFKGTSLNLSAEGNYRDYKVKNYHANQDAHNSGFGGGLFGGLRQDLPWKLKLGFHGGFRLKRIDLQGSAPGFEFYGMNLSRSFLADDRLTITLNAGNFISPKRNFRSETITPTFRSESVSCRDFMRFGIGVRYRLGSLKATVKKVARSIEDTDKIQEEDNSGQSGQGGSGEGSH